MKVMVYIPVEEKEATIALSKLDLPGAAYFKKGAKIAHHWIMNRAQVPNFLTKNRNVSVSKIS